MTSELQNNSFRDRISTVDKDGKRVWLYALKPKGKLYNIRTVISIFQLGLLVVLPFVKWNGHPVLMFNILERKVFFFGLIFRPHDAFIVALLLITAFVFVISFTSIFGRVWCGWLCPQTIFMEMVFRKIEYWIEGDSTKQKRLNQAAWDSRKIFKKGLKHFLFYSFSFVVSNVFLAYIIGVDALTKIVLEPPSQHLSGLMAIIIFSLIFYGVFSWFREQACLVVCPYGRLQSVMQDQNTLMVSYDYVRGEPRGKAIKNKPVDDKGDCVDCQMCTKVCPMGMDIRNGIQLECVNCTACIDSCDDIMEKLGKPKGLIRYASSQMIENRTGFKLSKRMISYAIVFIALVCIDVYFIGKRSSSNFIFNRMPGMLYQTVDENHISNIYDLQMINNSFEEKNLSIKLINPVGELRTNQENYNVKGDNAVDLKFVLVLPKDSITGKNTPIKIGIYEKDLLVKELSSSFFGPEKGVVAK